MKRWIAIGALGAAVLAIVLLVQSRIRSHAREASLSQRSNHEQHRQPTNVLGVNHDPPGTFQLTGRVVDETGTAVVGATIWLDSVPRQTTSSGTDGAFAFDKLLDRGYAIRAKAGTRIGGPQLARPAISGAPVLVELREGAHILVTVVDASRAPVAQAEVRVVGQDDTSLTNDHGQATVTTYPGVVTVEATDAVHAPRAVNVRVGSAGSENRVTIVMHEGFAVRGRVVDEHHRPIGDAKIYAQQQSAFPLDANDAIEDAVTDARGTFSIRSVVGMHTFVAIDDEHAPAATPSVDVDHAIDGLEIVMKSGGLVAGHVVDKSGKPVAGARVHCDFFGSLGQRRTSTTSDGRGAFEVRGLPRTLVMAHAASEQDVSEELDLDLTSQQELRDQKLVLQHSDASAVITGVVVDDTGAPVPDAIVNAVPDRSGPSRMGSDNVDTTTAASTRTDRQGAFTLTKLLPGDYSLWAGPFEPQPIPAEVAQHSPGSIDPSWLMTSARTGSKTVRLVLARRGAIRGKVVLAGTGASPKALSVELLGGPDTNAETSANGTFELRDVRPGTYKLLLRASEFEDTIKGDIHVAPGKATDLGAITVQPGGTLRGEVVDAAGRPVPGARVMVGLFGAYNGVGKFDEPDPTSKTALTDAKGAFTITGIQTRRRVGRAVGADHPSYGRALPITIGEGTGDPAPVTLTLRDCGSVTGKIMQDGQPVAGAIIGAGWPEMGSAITTDDGLFTISRLPVGTVVLRVMPPRPMSRNHQHTVQVEAGKATEVVIEIPTGTLTLAVAVTPKPGHDVAGAMLYLFSGTVTADTYAQVTTLMMSQGQGNARWLGKPDQPAAFERLVPGDYSVCAMPLAWSPDDQKQMKRVHYGDRESVKVYCTPIRVTPSPAHQSVTVEVPSMLPLP